jgi:cytochrome c-type biogenesis protein CcmH
VTPKILNYMVERYGDFVLYRPPVKGYTLLLWFGPFILLFGAVVLLIRFARQRKDLEVFDEAELQDIRTLLKQTSGDSK